MSDPQLLELTLVTFAANELVNKSQKHQRPLMISSCDALSQSQDCFVGNGQYHLSQEHGWARSVVRIRCWTGSVPPAVAGGCAAIRRAERLTHPPATAGGTDPVQQTILTLRQSQPAKQA